MHPHRTEAASKQMKKQQRSQNNLMCSELLVETPRDDPDRQISHHAEQPSLVIAVHSVYITTPLSLCVFYLALA